MSSSPQKRHEYLVEQIKHHNKMYYDLDAPLISDAEYDKLVRELEVLEESYPSLKTTNSLSETVGGSVRQDMKKIKHLRPLLSLQDYFNLDELAVFVDKMKQECGDYPVVGEALVASSEKADKSDFFLIEEKIDGLSVAIEYRNSVFYRAATRGNGHEGEDVTANVLTIKTLPKNLVLPCTKLVVRAEVYMSKDSFQNLNEEQEKRGENLFANPRNAAAGSLRRLDAEETELRQLDLFAFDILQIEGARDSSGAKIQLDTDLDNLKYLEAQSFPVVQYYKCSAEIPDIQKILMGIETKRAGLPYGIDGAVLKINSLALRDEVGEASKAPKWAAAYKYPPDLVETTVLAIVVGVGRTGKLTPLAELTPVWVDGSRISRATLHNEDFIRDKDIRIGDHVFIHKAGDVIPAVVEVNFAKRSASSEEFKMPNRCPVCNSVVERKENEASSYCENILCPAQLSASLEHFVARDNMNIAGLGEKTLELLVEKGLISSIVDIFKLKDRRLELLELDNFQETSVDKLLLAIEEAKHQEPYKLLSALGIRQVGQVLAYKLIQKYRNINRLRLATVEELVNIKDVGEVTAKFLVDFFSLDSNKIILDELEFLGLKFELTEQATTTSSIFTDKTVVITGKFNKFTRKGLQEKLLASGAKISSSVSKNTDYLLVGEAAGSKLAKAQGLQIAILDELELEKILGE